MSKIPYEHQSLAGIGISGLSTDDLKAIAGAILKRKIHGIAFSPYNEELKPGMQIPGAQIRERLRIVQPYVNWVRTFSCTEGNELIPQLTINDAVGAGMHLFQTSGRVLMHRMSAHRM